MPACLQELEVTSQVSRSTAATALRHLSALQAATGAATGVAAMETRKARAARDLAAAQCAQLILQLAASSEQLSCVCRHFAASRAEESECNTAVQPCGVAAERRMAECDAQMAVLQAELERSRADAHKAWGQVAELKADRDATVSQLEKLKLQVAELSADAESTAHQLPTCKTRELEFQMHEDAGKIGWHTSLPVACAVARHVPAMEHRTGTALGASCQPHLGQDCCQAEDDARDSDEMVHRGQTSSDLEVTVEESVHLASSPREAHNRLHIGVRIADECAGEQASSSAGGGEGVREPCRKCREWADKYHTLQAQSSHVATAVGQMEECVRCDELATRLQEAHSLAQTAETRWLSSKQACQWLESQLAAANQVPCPCA